MGVIFMLKNKESSYLIEILKVGLIGTIIAFILLSVVSFFALKADINDDYYKYFITIISVISGALSGFILARKRKEKGLINGIFASVLPAIIIFISSIAVGKRLNIYSTIPLFLNISGGIIGGIAGINIKLKKKKNNINRRK